MGICLCDLADDDLDNLALCGRAECYRDHPDAIHLVGSITTRSGDGKSQVDDVAAGGNAAVSSPAPPNPVDDESYDVDFGGDESPPETPVAGSLSLKITSASSESNARVREAADIVRARRQLDEAIRALNARDIQRLVDYMQANLPDVRVPFRDLTVVPLTEAEMRSMTSRMDMDDLQTFLNNREPDTTAPKYKARPTNRPAPKAAGRGTLQAGMLRFLFCGC